MAVYHYIFLPVTREPGAALGDQQRLLTEFSAEKGLQSPELFVEQNVSARKPLGQRPVGEQILAKLKPGDVMVCARVKWLFANGRDAAALIDELKRKGVSLYGVDLQENLTMPGERKLIVSEGNAELIQRLVKIFAEFETSSHGDAIKATKRVKKRQGKYLGGPVPFGWKIDEQGFFIKDQQQQMIIEEIKVLRDDRWSYRDISKKLRENHGISLSHEGIRRILTGDRQKKHLLDRRSTS